ncbi:MAG: porin family protein [Bacteroidetes bacterium]|nr:porin family protein [Bacteroidota bacterium]
MIKKFAIILSCGFLTFSIQAQDFGGGVILGLSTSQVGGDNLAGFHKAGLLLGVFANKSITELLSFQMEMTYIQKGSNNPNMNNPEHPNDSKQDISLSYIEVPLLLQYHQSDKLKIEGGVLTAYLVDGHYNDLSGKMTNPINPFISYDIGLLLGIDYKYSENISLNTRIGNSILPIGSEDYENQVYNSSKKGKYNSVLSFALHYNF